MNPKLIKCAEWIVAILLSATVLFVLVVRATHAGGLWRDECDSLELARLPTFADVLHNLKFTSFPVLFPTTVRLFTTLFGTSDATMRCFGFLISAALLVVAWFNARSVGRDVPLILPALAGLNITFLTVGTWIRGYGLGAVLIALAFGLTALFVMRPTLIRLIAMFLSFIASMQCLYFDAALVPPILLAAFAVCIFRGQIKWAVALCVIAIICALSYVPQFLTYFAIRDWTVTLKRATTLAELWQQFRLACGEPVRIMVVVWLTILSLSILGGAWKCLTKRRTEPAAELSAVIFASLTIVISAATSAVFVRILHNKPETRYYIALLCLLAASAELIIAALCQFRWVRLARLIVVIGLGIALPIFAWPKIIERETNVDLLAKGLERYGGSDDLIVVNRWFLGPSFSWHYRGPTRWMTLPDLSEKRIHRYDLLKTKMEQSDAIDDVRSAVTRTLQSGNRVWLVGGAQLSPEETALMLSPAPDPQFGWDSGMYDYAWSTQLGKFLQQHVIDGEVVLSPMSGVNSNENIPLLIARGWRD